MPCTEDHTAEVFYASNTHWVKQGGFPGDKAIRNNATAACNSAFASYVGIAYSKSLYTWTDIVPDASTWPGGDRGLHCVLYYRDDRATGRRDAAPVAQGRGQVGPLVYG